MKIITTPLKQKLLLILLTTFAFNQAIAESKVKPTEKEQVTHEQHKNHLAKKHPFHGVFYGVLPCKGCAGTKTTLSLKNRDNYLLVTQPAKRSSREFFEKGKYTWDDDAKLVTLTPKKGKTVRTYQITDEKTLTELSAEGKPLKSKQDKTSYVLHKGEMSKKKSGGQHAH